MTSIRARLVLLLAVLTAVAALAVGAITYRSVLGEVEALLDYQLRQMALSLREQGEIAGRDAASLADPELDLVVQVWSEDGRTVYASQVPSALPGRAVLGFADVDVNGARWRTFSVVGRSRVIQVAQPRAVRERQAAAAAWRSVTPLVVLAPLLTLAAAALVGLSLRPLRRVARAVSEREAATPRSLAPLPTAGLPDEVAPLVRSFNGLLERLALAFGAQRAFVADAAHELRSPLTALGLQLELLRRAGDAPSRDAAIAALGAGVERASRLVEQLLTLARSDPDAAATPHEAIDLAALAREVLAEHAAAAAARTVDAELIAADTAVIVQGDRAALVALVRNLLDNALRYSLPGSRVRVGVGRDTSRAPQLVVEDSGPGLAPAERERAFDRFWRRDPSAGAGSGLGLAIVRSVAARHGASVELDESPLGGLRATVLFPAPLPA